MCGSEERMEILHKCSYSDNVSKNRLKITVSNVSKNLLKKHFKMNPFSVFAGGTPMGDHVSVYCASLMFDLIGHSWVQRCHVTCSRRKAALWWRSSESSWLAKTESCKWWRKEQRSSTHSDNRTTSCKARYTNTQNTGQNKTLFAYYTV